MALAVEGPDLDDSMKEHSSNSGQTYAGKYCDTYLDVALLSSEEYNRTLCGTAASAWAIGRVR
jgi:hypothetical protein